MCSQLADYYYEERMCLLRCVLLLLTYFQDERHPYRVRNSLSVATSDSQTILLVVCLSVQVCSFNNSLLFFQAEYCNCVNKLEKDLVSIYQSQFENLFRAEAPTWETHGNLMVIISYLWFIFIYYAVS